MHNERVQRMKEAGILSEKQASMLHESLQRGRGSQQDTTVQIQKRSRLFLVLSIAGILAVVLILIWLLNQAGMEQVVQNVAQTMNQAKGGGVMNKLLSVILAVALFLVFPLILWTWIHNNLVTKEELVLSAWAQVESNYQRRSDLIPALVETVSRYLKHEKQTLVAVTKARSENNDQLDKIIDALVDAQSRSSTLLRDTDGKVPTDSSALKSLSEAQERVGLEMRKLVALIENYPELRSSEQFIALQAQLEGTENRINVARIRFNETVSTYNSAIRKMPGSLVAAVSNFHRKAYFEADEGADRAKKLAFD